jgi:hypothetical protein
MFWLTRWLVIWVFFNIPYINSSHKVQNGGRCKLQIGRISPYVLIVQLLNVDFIRISASLEKLTLDCA